jgi:hypothetical protein
VTLNELDDWVRFPRLLVTRWPWLIDMHLHYFDRHVIADLLARAGFELLRTERSLRTYALRATGRSPDISELVAAGV